MRALHPPILYLSLCVGRRVVCFLPNVLSPGARRGRRHENYAAADALRRRRLGTFIFKQHHHSIDQIESWRLNRLVLHSQKDPFTNLKQALQMGRIHPEYRFGHWKNNALFFSVFVRRKIENFAIVYIFLKHLCRTGHFFNITVMSI